MPDRPEAARGAGSGKAGAGGGTTGRKDRGGRSGASAGANGRGGRKSGGGRTNGGSGSRAGMGNDRVTGGGTGMGGTTPCRVYMYGTARPGDTGRGGRPLGGHARRQAGADRPGDDQRGDRVAGERPGAMRPEQNRGGRGASFRRRAPAAAGLERLHLGGFGHRHRGTADPQRPVRPCLRGGIRPAERLHRQRIQRLQVGEPDALPSLRCGTRRADAGRSVRRRPADTRPTALGHGRERGGRRNLERRQPHIGAFAHRRRTLVRYPRGTRRGGNRGRGDRAGKHPRHGDRLQRRDGKQGAAPRRIVRRALQLAEALFRPYAGGFGRDREHRYGTGAVRGHLLRGEGLRGVRGTLPARRERRAPQDTDGRGAENRLGIRGLQRRGRIPPRSGPRRHARK